MRTAAATGVFMPCLELTAVRTKHGSVSLYEASTHRALARKLIAAYQKSRGRALGELITGAALKHVKNDYLGDARDAMSTLDEVSDQDVARPAPRSSSRSGCSSRCRRSAACSCSASSSATCGGGAG